MAPIPKPQNSVTDTLRICPHLYIPIQAADSSAGHRFHRVRQEGVTSVGLWFPPKLMPNEGVCSNQGRWCLQCMQRSQLRYPDDCPFSSLSRTRNPSLASQDSSLLHPPFTEALAVWLQVRICPLALYMGTCISSKPLSHPGRQKPHSFSADMMWVPLLSSGALGWGTVFGVETPPCQGEPLHLRYPSGIFAAAPSKTSPSCISALPTGLGVTASVNSWL